MDNITLTYGELRRLLTAFAVTVVVIGLTIAVLFQHWFEKDILSGVMRALNASLTTTALVFYGFYKYAWRWSLVAELMGKPLVFGVWIGTLRSDYGKSDGEHTELPIVFVIRQDYLSIHISSYTRSQEGSSRVEALIRNSRSETTILAYIFDLQSQYAGATMKTSGTGELRLQVNGNELSGTYWTNTPTHGSIELKLMTRDISGVGRFADAAAKWPHAITSKSRSNSAQRQSSAGVRAETKQI